MLLKIYVMKLITALRLYIEGPKKGLVEPFALNLPGFPDNIARSSDGGYWVAIVSPRHNGSFDSYGFAGRHPRVRNWLTKVLYHSTTLYTTLESLCSVAE